MTSMRTKTATTFTSDEEDAFVVNTGIEDRTRMDVCTPSTSQEELELPGPSECKKKRGLREILTEKLSSLLDLCQISDRNATRILIATIEALGQNPDDYKVPSKSSEKFCEKILLKKS
uniref:Uncharacterized protein n=1 Tax=Cacopsylla melanoneura TaxID=428564 RepID=A0A8D9EA15_9HEMI